MKRIVFLIVSCLMAYAASAQTVVDIKGSRVFQGGEKLSKEEAVLLMSDINGMDMSDDYLKYRKGYKAGLGMTIGGASLALVGAAGTVTSVLLALPYAFAGKESTMLDVALGTSMVCAVGGIAVMIAGIPTLCVYKKRLNGLETEISAHPGGIGLTLRF